MARRFYVTHTPDEVVARFAPLGAGEPEWNWPVVDEVAPLQTAPMVVSSDEGAAWRRARWGLVPAGTPDAVTAAQVAERLTLARAESLSVKPIFSEAFARRRCIVPASGFWVWAQHEGERLRLRVQPRDGGLLALAGVWDVWRTETGRNVRTFALVSVAANRLLAPLGTRMPAVLRAGEAWRWLDTESLPSERRALLRPYASRDLVLLSARGEKLSSELQESILRGAEAERRERLTFPTRRVLKREEVSPDGKVFFSTRSWTRNTEKRWYPVVDTHDGSVWCDCPDFRFRYARYDPTLETPHLWCKHVARAIRNCARHGELKRDFSSATLVTPAENAALR